MPAHPAERHQGSAREFPAPGAPSPLRENDRQDPHAPSRLAKSDPTGENLQQYVTGINSSNYNKPKLRFRACDRAWGERWISGG